MGSFATWDRRSDLPDTWVRDMQELEPVRCQMLKVRLEATVVLAKWLRWFLDERKRRVIVDAAVIESIEYRSRV